MTAVNSVLIVGGGTSGCALATLLGRAGVSVEIAEINPDWTALGSGITLQGNALRVLDELGVLEEVLASGYAFDELGLRSASGELLAEVVDARTGGPDLPATLGMERPRLARILAAAAREAGVKVRLGSTVASFRQDAAGVDVLFDDGAKGRYDLLVGADGIRSHVRDLLWNDEEPEPTGLSIWRIRGPRPSSVVRTEMCYDGPCLIAGYCPTGEDSMYAYLVEPSQDRTGLSGEERVAVVRDLAAAYGGAWTDIRADISDPDRLHYTAFESLLVHSPWGRDRTVLIGDAAHACPPTLAQGAAMCLEDASVLAELLLAADELNEAVWASFTARRFERVRTIVAGSLQIAQWMRERDRRADVPGLIHRIADIVGRPA